MLREETIEYFEFHRKIFCEDHLKICPKDSIAYQATLKEKEFYDLAIKALKQDPIIDKIRERIELEKLGYPPSAGYYKAIMKCLQIIDKYKKEGRANKGKWIDTKEICTNRRGQIVHEVICSECNGISYFRGMDGKYIGANLCPNCGKEMEDKE